MLSGFKRPMSSRPPESISVLRLDEDWNESTKLCLERLYPGLARGGTLLIDDYYCWEGCKIATDEYRKKHGITEKIHRIDQDSCTWVKKN